ncbi:MAG: DUF6765 family protein [Nannocystaceae bacterium]
MQIDFHHAVTYVVSRLAGLSHAHAETVAHSAQYVDDATNAGTIRFTNGAMYERISSAHKMLDYRNFEALANHRVWVPFHFLPGNGGLPADREPEGSFIDKLRCVPDSPIAQDMVRAAFAMRAAPWGLHRLGIAMHVYCDTWAHQGFAGVSHELNDADDLTGADGLPDRSLMNRLTSFFVGEALPLGHGAVLGHPDKPYLRWGYTDGRGVRIQRDNPRDFLAAVVAMHRVLHRYRVGDMSAPVPELAPRDLERIDSLLRGLQDPDGDRRHAAWLEGIARGEFSFGPATPRYIAKGVGSWKHAALGTTAAVDDLDDTFDYHPNFLRSDWKLFHDALQEHRFVVLHHILPRYGICAA